MTSMNFNGGGDSNVFSFASGTIGSMTSRSPPRLEFFEDSQGVISSPFRGSRSLPPTPTNNPHARRPKLVRVPSSPVARATVAPPSPVTRAEVVCPEIGTPLVNVRGRSNSLGHPRWQLASQPLTAIASQHDHVPMAIELSGSVPNSPLSSQRSLNYGGGGDDDVEMTDSTNAPTVFNVPSCNLTNQDVYNLWKSRNQTVNRIPTMPNGEEVDIGRLVDVVNSLGGIKHVRNHKLWHRVVANGGLNPSAGQDRVFLNKVKRFYAKYIVQMENDGLIPASTLVAQHMEGITNAAVKKRKNKSKSRRRQPQVNSGVAASMDALLSSFASTSNNASVFSGASTGVGDVSVGGNGDGGMRVSSVEQRRSMWLEAPTPKHRSRFEQMKLERMLMLNNEVSGEMPGARVKVLETAIAHVAYEVVIAHVPTCTCNDYAQTKTPCKHVLFCLAKVFKVPTNSPLFHQNAFLTEELRQILNKSVPSNNAQAPVVRSNPTDSQRKFLEDYDSLMMDATSFLDDNLAFHSHVSDMSHQQTQGECPLCFDFLSVEPNFTHPCGLTFHLVCYYDYQQQHGGGAKCPKCNQLLTSQQSPSARVTQNATTIASSPYGCFGSDVMDMAPFSKLGLTEDAYADSFYFAAEDNDIQMSLEDPMRFSNF